jgi:hypothetical protein
VALVGFGVDSFVETTSGAVVGWRLRAELVGQLDKEYAEHLELRRAGSPARFCSASRSTSWWTLVGASSGGNLLGCRLTITPGAQSIRERVFTGLMLRYT